MVAGYLNANEAEFPRAAAAFREEAATLLARVAPARPTQPLKRVLSDYVALFEARERRAAVARCFEGARVAAWAQRLSALLDDYEAHREESEARAGGAAEPEAPAWRLDSHDAVDAPPQQPPLDPLPSSDRVTSLEPRVVRGGRARQKRRRRAADDAAREGARDGAGAAASDGGAGAGSASEGGGLLSLLPAEAIDLSLSETLQRTNFPALLASAMNRATAVAGGGAITLADIDAIVDDVLPGTEHILHEAKERTEARSHTSPQRPQQHQQPHQQPPHQQRPAASSSSAAAAAAPTAASAPAPTSTPSPSRRARLASPPSKRARGAAAASGGQASDGAGQ